MVQAVAAPQARTDIRRFYVVMALACVATAFGFFSLTYWGPLAGGRFHASPVVHVHAAVFSTWVLLLLAQTWFAATGRLQHHRAWGVVGVSLATAMVFVGLWAALRRVVEETARGHAEAAYAFAIVPVSGIALFAVLMAVAFANVRSPEIHKRLVLVATIGLLQAAAARLFFILARPSPDIVHPGEAPPPPVAFSLGSALLVDLLIVAAMLYDWRTRGRPHPAYLIAGSATLAVQLLRVPLSETAAWRWFLQQLLAVATG
jgi:hypothetical protein